MPVCSLSTRAHAPIVSPALPCVVEVCSGSGSGSGSVSGSGVGVGVAMCRVSLVVCRVVCRVCSTICSVVWSMSLVSVCSVYSPHVRQPCCMICCCSAWYRTQRTGPYIFARFLSLLTPQPWSLCVLVLSCLSMSGLVLSPVVLCLVLSRSLFSLSRSSTSCCALRFAVF